MYDITKHVSTTSSLTKEEMAHHKLAVDYAKVAIAKRKFAITAISALVAAAGLGFALFSFIATQKEAVRQQALQDERVARQQVIDLKSQLTLKFVDLKSAKDQFLFVENIKKIKGLDPEIIASLEAALVQPVIDAPTELTTSESDITTLRNIEANIEGLLGKERRQARLELSKNLVICPPEICVSYIDRVFQVDDLRTSRSYRLALGIAVAIANVEGNLAIPESDFGKLFSDIPETASVKEKLAILAKANEKAIREAARSALRKFET